MRGRTEPCPAIELERGIGIELWADAADAAIGLRVFHVFQRIHRGHAEVALRVLGEIEFAAQLLAGERQHRIVLGARDIAHAHQRGVGAPTGRTHGQQRQLAPTAPGDGFHLDPKAVAGIDHQVQALTQQGFDIARGQESLDRVGFDVRVDRHAALGHRPRLVATVLPGQRRQLPVGVGHAHVIGIDQADVPHPGACQCLDHPRAHPTHADHRHAARRQALDRADPVQPVDTGKAFTPLCFHRPILRAPLRARPRCRNERCVPGATSCTPRLPPSPARPATPSCWCWAC